MAKALRGLAFGPAAAAFLNKMPPGKLRARIAKKARALLTNPHPPGSKKLHGSTDGDDPVYRVRQGDYRILYAVRDNPNQIIVLDIGHRKDVYR